MLKMPNGDCARCGASLKGFEIAGEDKVFYPAFAEIETSTTSLTVSSDKVPHPVARRYAYKKLMRRPNVFKYSWSATASFAQQITGKK